MTKFRLDYTRSVYKFLLDSFHYCHELLLCILALLDKIHRLGCSNGSTTGASGSTNYTKSCQDDIRRRHKSESNGVNNDYTPEQVGAVNRWVFQNIQHPCIIYYVGYSVLILSHGTAQ